MTFYLIFIFHQGVKLVRKGITKIKNPSKRESKCRVSDCYRGCEKKQNKTERKKQD